MNYQKHYDALILRAKIRLKCADYTENHHILPKCVNGDDSPDNLVKLTAREHFIAHALLAKIYKGTSDGYKLISAFRYMTVDSHNGARNNNRDYAWMRKMYSENHPTKQPCVIEKMIATTSARRAAGLYGDERTVERIIVECKCGCGEKFEKKVNEDKVYIAGHSNKVRYEDNEEREKQSVRLKNHIKSLSETELSDRMKNSFGSCDSIKRGNAISLAKKGKKTNQQELEIQKYGKMSEDEFNEFIKNKTKGVITRTTNKRKKYFDRNDNS